MLEDFYNEINKLLNNRTDMHKCPARSAESPIGLITPKINSSMVKTPCATSANYTVDKINRILTVKGKIYIIPDFFNIDNLISGEIKTIDYVFTYFNLDYG